MNTTFNALFVLPLDALR